MCHSRHLLNMIVIIVDDRHVLRINPYKIKEVYDTTLDIKLTSDKKVKLRLCCD